MSTILRRGDPVETDLETLHIPTYDNHLPLTPDPGLDPSEFKTSPPSHDTSSLTRRHIVVSVHGKSPMSIPILIRG